MVMAMLIMIVLTMMIEATETPIMMMQAPETMMAMEATETMVLAIFTIIAMTMMLEATETMFLMAAKVRRANWNT